VLLATQSHCIGQERPTDGNRAAGTLADDDLSKAIADYNRSPRFAPNQDRVGEAMHAFDEVIGREPNNAAAYALRAFTRISCGWADGAIADFDEVIRLNPTSAGAYAYRGFFSFRKKDYDKAIADYGEAIRLDPGCADFFFNRGCAWQMKLAYDKALTDLDEAVRLDPALAEAHNRAAWLRGTCADERYRDGNKAVYQALQACDLSGWENANFCDSLAAAYAEAGDFESAVRCQNLAIELGQTETQVPSGAKRRLRLFEFQLPYREKQLLARNK
jgi:tetratricopeptide (TPR) repeat protein